MHNGIAQETSMSTVAAISFRNNQSLSMDIEAVSRIEMGSPIEVEDGVWCCEMLVRSSNGVVALQLLSDNPEKLKVPAPVTTEDF